MDDLRRMVEEGPSLQERYDRLVVEVEGLRRVEDAALKASAAYSLLSLAAHLTKDSPTRQTDVKEFLERVGETQKELARVFVEERRERVEKGVGR